MIRRVIKSAMVAAVAVATSLVAPAGSPAQAHTSTYCGHGVDGIVWVTEYGGSITYPEYHMHKYYHIHWFYAPHDEWRRCPQH